MRRSRHILVAAVLALIPSASLAAEGQDAPADRQSDDATYQPVFTDGKVQPAHVPQFLGRGPSTGVSDPVVRFGWWGTQNSGQPTKTGEWQGLDPGPFYDVDGLSSDGSRTANFFVTGTENESTRAHLDYFGPAVETNIDYDRFPHRLDHDPIANFRDTNGEASPYIGKVTDLNVGEDYAIRVQEFDAKFKGHITENLKWRVNVWGMRKQGERQADAMSHSCGSNPTGKSRPCHIGSQRQRIDWLTTEIEPALEGKAGPLTVEYSRTMRAFEQNDQGVASGVFDATSPFNSFYNSPSRFADAGISGNSHPYGIVPDNYTQIDRLKFGVEITEDTDLYALLHYGDTENRNRGTHRTFNGWDFRLTNRAIDGVTLAAYGKGYSENNELPSTFPEANAFTKVNGVSRDIAETRHPVDRDKEAFGAKARWALGQRRYSSTGWALASGYEYSTIERGYVTFVGSPAASPLNFTQPTTTSHLIYVGPEWRVSSALDTFVRYKMINTRNPLYGFRENQIVADPDNSIDTAVNTNQPQHVDGVEFGGTWTPADNFLLSATFGIETRTHLSGYADFDQKNYPILFSAWWAPTDRLSLSGALGFYSDYVTQDITLGTNNPATDVPVTSLWNYQGRTDLVNFGATYRWTDRISLTGGAEWLRGVDRFADPSIPGTLDVAYIADASNVIVETWRLTTGIDYLLSQRASIYFRYVYYDYNDKSFARTGLDPDPNSGTSNFFLGGFSATF